MKNVLKKLLAMQEVAKKTLRRVPILWMVGCCSCLSSPLPIASLSSFSLDVQILPKRPPFQMHFIPFPLSSSSAKTDPDPYIPGTFVLTIPKGRVYSDKGYVIVLRRSLVKEMLWPWSPLLKGEQSIEESTLPAIKKIKGKVVVLAQEGYQNYYHWMTEILPKIALLKDIPYDWLCLPPLTLPFQKETLLQMGIDFKKIIEMGPLTYMEADQLIVPSFVSRSCVTPKWVADGLRNAFLPSCKNSGQTLNESKLLFISRSKAPSRRVHNEADVFSLLSPLGFTSVCVEDLSFSAQVRLFQQAKVVVAFHGAGLTNLLFCKPKTLVVEIFQAREDDTFCYLSQTLDLNYVAIPTTKFLTKGYIDTVVPLQKIKNAIERYVVPFLINAEDSRQNQNPPNHS